MATTVRDFVKMLYKRECDVVVMLCVCEEGGVEVCAQYLATHCWHYDEVWRVYGVHCQH